MKRTVVTEETLDDNDVRFEISPQKSLKQLSQETGVSWTSG
jgi:hypothetical protein